MEELHSDLQCPVNTRIAPPQAAAKLNPRPFYYSDLAIALACLVLDFLTNAKLLNLSADNNSTMTLIEQCEAVLYGAQFYLDRLTAEVYQRQIELLSKAILCAK